MSLLSPQLQAFVAIAECRTVHAAAETLCLTQTAVTQRLRVLERQLRSTLFIRTRRGMVLTPEGDALLRYCQAALSLEGEAMSQIHGAGTETQARLTISSPTSLMRSRVIPACLPIMKQFEKLLMYFQANDLDERHQLLRNGHIDFAILHSQHVAQEMKSKPLRSEEHVLVASALWKDRSLNNIIQTERIIDFDPSDTMTFDYLKHYDLYHEASRDRYFSNRTDQLAYLLVQGVGYSTLSIEFVMPYVERGELIILNEGCSFDFNPFLVWFERPEPSPYFSAVIAAIE